MEPIAEYIINHQGFILLGLIAAGVRITYSKESFSLKKLFLVLFATMFLIGISVEYLTEEIESKGLRTAVIGFIALSAPDIVDFILKAWIKVKEDPLSILRELADRFLGKGG